MQVFLPKSVPSQSSVECLMPSPHAPVQPVMSNEQSAAHLRPSGTVEPKSRQVLPLRLVPSHASIALIMPSPHIPTRHSPVWQVPLPNSGIAQPAPSAFCTHAVAIDCTTQRPRAHAWPTGHTRPPHFLASLRTQPTATRRSTAAAIRDTTMLGILSGLPRPI